MNREFKSKRVMVVDKGLFVSWALRLAREFGEVYYHNTAWKTLSPRTHELTIGHGFQEITMVRNFWSVAHDIDLFVFPYIFDGDLQKELVRQGKRVWGARMGDDLEIYRAEAKEEMRRLGLPVGEYALVTGISALRDFLAKHPNVHVKIPLTRGDMESFHSPSYEEIIPKLREIEHELDDAAEEMEFVVEKPIDPALEIGYDGWSINGEFPSKALNGVEIKDSAYIGVILPYEKLDDHVRFVNSKLAPALQDYGYTGLLSTEIRVGPDEKPYLIDITCRAASPGGESMQEIIGNWAEIMWHGAEGVLVEPEEEAKYSAQAVIYSEFADEGWQPVTFPDEIRNRVKLFFHRKIKNRDRVIPQHAKFSEIGWVVGLGDTVKDAIKDCRDIAEQVTGYKVEVRTEGLDRAVEEIEKGERMGVRFSDEPVEA